MSCLSNGKYQNWTAQFRVHGVNTGADLFFIRLDFFYLLNVLNLFYFYILSIFASF